MPASRPRRVTGVPGGDGGGTGSAILRDSPKFGIKGESPRGSTGSSQEMYSKCRTNIWVGGCTIAF